MILILTFPRWKDSPAFAGTKLTGMEGVSMAIQSIFELLAEIM